MTTMPLPIEPLPVPSPLETAAACETCGGAGELYSDRENYTECWACDGTGYRRFEEYEPDDGPDDGPRYSGLDGTDPDVFDPGWRVEQFGNRVIQNVPTGGLL